MEAFCHIVRTSERAEDELNWIHSKLQEMSKIKRFVTVTESVAELSSGTRTLANMEMAISQMVPTAQLNVKVSTITEFVGDCSDITAFTGR